MADAPLDVMEWLSHGLRGAIIPSEGKLLYVADFAGIEARVLLWLADDQEALQTFLDGSDLYCDFASEVYGYPCISKKTHPVERVLGKTGVLGLGYQMGAAKFVDTAAKLAQMVITEEFSQKVVDAYREKFWRVKQLWYDQEDAAIRATLKPGSLQSCGYIEWQVRGRFLYATLPSGRHLAYPDAQIRERQTPWGATKSALTYMGTDPYTRKWTRQTSYGGLLVENLTQAVARDLMAEALVRCDASGIYTPILSVHDELLAEGPFSDDSVLLASRVRDFEQLMAACPVWADGCPIAAEGWAGVRYHK